MENMLQECLKPHALLHTVTGIGLGIILMSFFPYTPLETVRFMGVALIAIAFLGECVVHKPKSGRKH